MKHPSLDHHTVMALDEARPANAMVNGRECHTKTCIVGILEQDGHLTNQY